FERSPERRSGRSSTMSRACVRSSQPAGFAAKTVATLSSGRSRSGPGEQGDRMTRTRVVRLAGTLGAFLLSAPIAADQAIKPDAQGFIVAQPEDVKFADGAQSQVVIAGDPAKPGIYVIRIRFAPGNMSRPHFHDQDRYVTVMKGTWWVALGPEADKFDPAKTKPVKAGSIVKHPAGAHRYDGAKEEEVIVQIIGMGPVKTTPIGGQ